MKRLLIVILAFFALLLSACSQGDSDGKEQDGPGFGQLSWGESYDALMKSGDHRTEIVQLGVTYAGYSGEAHYAFDENGRLSAGYYCFEYGSWESGTQVYQGLMEHLTAKYGPGEEILQGGNDENGEAIPAPDIADVIAAGEGGCVDMWSKAEKAGEKDVSITLQLFDSGRVVLAFMTK